MLAYIARRILLMIPTILGIMLISFVDRAVRAGRAGGAHHRAVAGQRLGATSRISAAAAATSAAARRARRRRADASPRAIAARRGSIRQFIKQLETQFGFDKPAHERFLKMLWDYARFDFGKSYFRDVSVLSSSGKSCRSRSRSACG